MNQTSKKRFKQILIITVAILCAGVTAGFIASRGIAIPCVFYRLTGLQCPGCGNTRAAVALMRLDLAESLRYNPLFIPEALYLVWVYACCAVGYIKGKSFAYKPRYVVIDAVFLAVLILWGIIRNVI